MNRSVASVPGADSRQSNGGMEERMRLMRFKDRTRCPDAMGLAEWLDSSSRESLADDASPGEAPTRDAARPARLDAVVDHLARCAECRRAAIELRRILSGPDEPKVPVHGRDLALACAARLRFSHHRPATLAARAAMS